jgi:hypothetical protein
MTQPNRAFCRFLAALLLGCVVSRAAAAVAAAAAPDATGTDETRSLTPPRQPAHPSTMRQLADLETRRSFLSLC